MRFENPQNNFVEEVSAPWLWTLLFGVFYFMIKGIWTHVFVIALLVFFSFALLGPGGALLALPAWALYAFAANDIVRKHYLRKGWKEI